MNKLKNNKVLRLNNISLWVGLIGGLIGIISFIPQIKDFLGWTQTLKYVELNASFPNEKWLEAKEEDYKWLVGEWDVPKLRGFIAVFKIENRKLFRQNKGTDFLHPEENFISKWYPTKVYKSNNNMLRMAFPEESKWPLSFIRKDDDCACYETERYIDNDGSVKSSDGRQMLNIEHTKLSSDGMIYECY